MFTQTGLRACVSLFWNDSFVKCSVLIGFHFEGSFENEALENEDRSTKHPKLENETPKTRKRSTQNSKTKHPKLENEAPKIENEAPKTRKRSTQNTRHRSALYKHETNVNTAEIKRDNEYSITKRMQFKSSQAPKNSKTKHPKLENEAPKTRKRSTQKTRHWSVLYKHETNVNTAEIKRDNEYSITENAQTISRMLLYCQ